MTKMIKTVIASLIGGVVFLVFLLVLHAGFLLALLVGGLGVIGAFFLLPATIGERAEALEKTQAQAQAAKLKIAQDNLALIKHYNMDIIDSEMKTGVKRICIAGDWMMDYLKKNPKDIPASSQFLNYYLSATLSIVEKFQSLESGKGFSETQKTQLYKAKNMIETVATSFDKQISKIVEDDFMDLSVEMEVLEKTLKAEGIFDE